MFRVKGFRVEVKGVYLQFSKAATRKFNEVPCPRRPELPQTTDRQGELNLSGMHASCSYVVPVRSAYLDPKSM